MIAAGLEVLPVDGGALPPPSLEVARTFSADGAALGLDGPLPLLGGGSVLHPTGAVMSLGLEHQPDFVRAVAHACRIQALAGRDWYSHGAMALVGAPGAGRGHAARRLAAVTGLPLFTLDVSSPAGLRVLEGSAEDGCAAVAPFAIAAMASSGCANPIILVEGLGGGDRTARMLEPFVDPARSTAFTSGQLEASFDLGQVNWLLQFTDDLTPRRLPAGSISIVPFPVPDADQGLRMRLLSLAIDVAPSAAMDEVLLQALGPRGLGALSTRTVVNDLRAGGPPSRQPRS